MTEEQEAAVHAFLDQEVKNVHVAARAPDTYMCIFNPDFFQRYSVKEIPTVLRGWNLPKRIQQSPHGPVVVTADGLWNTDGMR